MKSQFPLRAEVNSLTVMQDSVYPSKLGVFSNYDLSSHFNFHLLSPHLICAIFAHQAQHWITFYKQPSRQESSLPWTAQSAAFRELPPDSRSDNSLQLGGLQPRTAASITGPGMSPVSQQEDSSHLGAQIRRQVSERAAGYCILNRAW